MANLLEETRNLMPGRGRSHWSVNESSPDWKSAAKKLLSKRTGKSQHDLHYRAYLRAIISGDTAQATHMVQNFPAAKKAQAELIDLAGMGESVEEAKGKKGHPLTKAAARARALWKQEIKRAKKLGRLPDSGKVYSKMEREFPEYAHDTPLMRSLVHDTRPKHESVEEAKAAPMPPTMLKKLKSLSPEALRLLNTMKDYPKYRGQAASDAAKNALDQSGLTSTIHALEDPAKDVVRLTKMGQKVVAALKKRGLSAVQVVKESVAGAPGAFAVSDAEPPSLEAMKADLIDRVRNPRWEYPSWALPKVQLDEENITWHFKDARSAEELARLLKSTWRPGPVRGMAEKWMQDITIGEIQGATLVLGGPAKLQEKLASLWNKRGGGMKRA